MIIFLVEISCNGKTTEKKNHSKSHFDASFNIILERAMTDLTNFRESMMALTICGTKNHSKVDFDACFNIILDRYI